MIQTKTYVSIGIAFAKIKKPSLNTGGTTIKCSGHISTKTEIFDNKTRLVTDDAVSNNTTEKNHTKKQILITVVIFLLANLN